MSEIDRTFEQHDRRIADIVGGHHARWEAERPLLQRMRAAADNRLWTDGYPRTWSFMTAARPANMPEPYPVRVQVNLLRPWLQKGVGSLYLRAPRVTAKPPMVRPPGARGRVDDETVQAVQALCEGWLSRQNIKSIVEQAMENALLYPGAALKVGFDPTLEGSAFDKVWVDPLTCWEALWNQNAHSLDTMRYVAHLRWESVEKASTLLDVDLLEREEKLYPMGDYLAHGTEIVPNDGLGYRDEGYVQLLDWHDIAGGTFSQLLVRPGRTPELVRFSPPAKPLYRWPTGQMMVPIEPLVLANSPGFRYMPISLAVPIYEQGCEKSLILTTIINSFRRDAARVMLFLKEKGLGDEQVARIMQAVDGEFVGLELDEVVDLAKLFAPLALPDIHNTLREAYQWLGQAGAESSPMSQVGQGGTGGLQYAAATLVQNLASSDAATLTAPAARMNTILGRLLEMLLVILSSHEGGVAVLVGGEWRTLSAETLGLRWEITVEDSLAAQGLNQARRAELVQGAPVYVTAVASAATPDPPPDQGPPIPDEVRLANERLVNVICDTYDLPPHMRWEALKQAAEQRRRKREREAPETPDADDLLGPAGAPEAPVEEPVVDDLDPEAVAQLLTGADPRALRGAAEQLGAIPRGGP